MSIESLLMMLGGIGMFLYGMKLMGNSLEHAAGAKMEKILERLTSNKAKGVALGAGVTAVIQSSAATIIMVVGFLNAGIMNLAQGVPVVMGANIGTTITAQILRMGDIQGDNLLLTMLKPSSFAPILILISALVILMGKKQSTKDKMGILMGLGILFMGMTLMENSFAPLAESPEFAKVFTLFENPFLGVLVGIAVTVLLQSSSASVGVLQATASTGVVTYAMAMPITIGCNLGKCVTVLLASVGVNKDAKRAVYIDVMMCVFGSILFLVVIYLYQTLIGFGFWENTVNRGGVANFHTFFNLAIAIIFLPLINWLISLARKLVKDTEETTKMDKELAMLDPRFLETPGVALEQCRKVINLMCTTNRESFDHAFNLITNYNDVDHEIVENNEEFTDKTETVLGEYIVEISERPLSARQNVMTTEMLHTIGDMERIGDHIVNLAEEAQILYGSGMRFSSESLEELVYVKNAIDRILDLTNEAYEKENTDEALKVIALEDVMDDIIAQLKANHIRRLQEGTCTVERGVSFIEMLTDVERISDHCENISKHLRQRLANQELNLHEDMTSDVELSRMYDELCDEYRKEFLDPITHDSDQLQFI